MDYQERKLLPPPKIAGYLTARAEHDGICIECGLPTPCLEAECDEPPGHPYVCENCLRKNLSRRTYMDAIESDVRFGY